MPSFDIVSEINRHELVNAVDQANREISTRFDFKGTDANFQLTDLKIELLAQEEFQLKQMLEILQLKMTKRGIELGSLTIKSPIQEGRKARQTIEVCEGIETNNAKDIVKIIKDSKLKVQASIQGDKVRVTGNKRDDLQEAMALLRNNSKITLPLQFNNFRD